MMSKRISLTLAFALFSICAISQSEGFNQRFDALNNEVGDGLFSVLQTNYGFICFGGTRSLIETNNNRLWLYGIDHEGELMWEKTYFPDSVFTQAGWSNSADYTSDGSYVTPVNERRPSNSRVLHIMKFDQNGDSIWTCSYPCSSGSYYLATSARETSDGGVVSVGATDDHSASPNYRPFAMKCDADGNLLWFKQYYSPTSTIIASVVATDDGGGIMGGTQYVNGYTSKRFFLLRFDADGNELWRTLYNGEPSPSPAWLTRWGNRFYFGAVLETENSSLFRPYIQRFSPNTGELIWENESEPCASCPALFVFAVETDANGNIIGGGPVNSWDSGAPFENGHLIKWNDEGERLWLRKYHFAEQTDCIFRDLRVTDDGGIVAAGHAGNNDEYPSYDGWVIKTDEHGCIVPGCHVGVLENDATAAFKLYPNPAHDIVNLYLETDQSRPRGTITIHDLQGREVKNFAAPQGETTYIVDVSMLPSGMYVVSYNDGEVLVTERLIVE